MAIPTTLLTPSHLPTRPFITLSYAQSLDGYIAPPIPYCPFAISSSESLTITHRIRSHHDAILVGIGTVVVDDPRLSIRLPRDEFLSRHNSSSCDEDTKRPETETETETEKGNEKVLRPIVLDSHLRIPMDSNLVSGTSPHQNRPWIFTSIHSLHVHVPKVKRLQEKGCRVFTCPFEPPTPTSASTSVSARDSSSSRLDLKYILNQLFQEGIESVMVEGGACVLSSFLDAGLVDKLIVTTGPVLLGQGVRIETQRPIISRFREVSNHQVGCDVVTIATL